jgi:hypothetical protein
MEDKHTPLEYLWEEEITIPEGFINCCHQDESRTRCSQRYVLGGYPVTDIR